MSDLDLDQNYKNYLRAVEYFTENKMQITLSGLKVYEPSVDYEHVFPCVFQESREVT